MPVVTPNASGYAVVTRQTRAVTRVTRLRHPRVHVYTLGIPITMKRMCAFTYTFLPTRNRVTHVTTGIPRVTVGVTGTFTRNHQALHVMKKEDGVDKKKWVQENLPVCAAVAAEFNAVFGDVRLVYASENGHTLGKPSAGDAVKLSETLVGPMRLKGEK